MNKAILMGRLTRDPEVRCNPDGSVSYARYSIAIDRPKKKDQKEGDQTADFISCVVFGKGAEFAEKWLKKGTKILISGHIQTGSYTNREGQKVYTTDVIVDSQEFAEKAEKQDAPAPSPDGFMDIPDGVDFDGLPFNM